MVVRAFQISSRLRYVFCFGWGGVGTWRFFRVTSIHEQPCCIFVRVSPFRGFCGCRQGSSIQACSKHVLNMFRNKSLVLLTYPDHKSKPRSRSKRFWPLPSSRTSRWLASHHPRSPLCCPWASPWNPLAAGARTAASAGDLKKVRMWVCLTQLQVNTRIK